jgi:hypothetical protein
MQQVKPGEHSCNGVRVHSTLALVAGETCSPCTRAAAVARPTPTARASSLDRERANRPPACRSSSCGATAEVGPFAATKRCTAQQAAHSPRQPTDRQSVAKVRVSLPGSHSAAQPLWPRRSGHPNPSGRDLSPLRSRPECPKRRDGTRGFSLRRHHDVFQPVGASAGVGSAARGRRTRRAHQAPVQLRREEWTQLHRYDAPEAGGRSKVRLPSRGRGCRLLSVAALLQRVQLAARRAHSARRIPASCGTRPAATWHATCVRSPAAVAPSSASACRLSSARRIPAAASIRTATLRWPAVSRAPPCDAPWLSGAAPWDAAAHRDAASTRAQPPAATRARGAAAACATKPAAAAAAAAGATVDLRVTPGCPVGLRCCSGRPLRLQGETRRCLHSSSASGHFGGALECGSPLY